MTLDYVNNEMLWLQNTLQGYFQKCWLRKNDVMSQVGIPITQLWYVYIDRAHHNKKLKGGIAACYDTWFYEYP